MLCVDQLEETIDQLPSESDGRRWHYLRQAINVLIDVADALPNAIVVIACLEDLFQVGRNYLPKPKLDRLMHDPEELRLRSERSLEEVESMLARRLGVLYAEKEVSTREQETIFPFRREHLQTLAGMRTRDVLAYFRRHRDRCMQAGTWVEPDGATPVQTVVSENPLRLEQAWNDALAAFEMPTLDDETHVAGLLAWSYRQYFGRSCRTASRPGRSLRMPTSKSASAARAAAAQNCSSRSAIAMLVAGGSRNNCWHWLGRVRRGQVVVVRTSPFPANPTTEIAKQLAALMEPKGTWRREEMLSTDLRYLEAFRVFHKQHQGDADFPAWQAHRRPLSNVKSIHAILALDSLQAGTSTSELAEASLPTPPPPPPATPLPPQPAPPASEPGMLQLGKTRGLNPKPVTVPVRDLTQHAAFLGGSGSGKTTAALCLIEQLLEQGVPAVLIDRKGDLCRYADPDAWVSPDHEDPGAGSALASGKK